MCSAAIPGEASSAGATSEALAQRSQAVRGALTRYFIRRVRDAAEADDLVQEVFLRIIKRGGTDGLDQFEAYAFETAASVLKDRRRRRTVRHSDQHVELHPDALPTTDPGPHDTLAGREALRATAKALGELPERTRTIFILRRLERLSYGEIAKRVGISVSAIEKHMMRATAHLVGKAGDIR
jgi:RNA polymerase sigma factor (sigma-70 family)